MDLKNLRGRVAFIFTEIDFDVDQIIDVFADFLCRHRNAPHKPEVK